MVEGSTEFLDCYACRCLYVHWYLRNPYFNWNRDSLLAARFPHWLNCCVVRLFNCALPEMQSCLGVACHFKEESKQLVPLADGPREMFRMSRREHLTSCSSGLEDTLVVRV